MAAKKRISFTINGGSTYRGKLAIRFKAPNSQATFAIVKGLHPNTDLSKWNEESQQFVGLGDTAVNFNNELLQKLLPVFQTLESNTDLYTSTLLKNAWSQCNNVVASNKIKLGEWAKMRVKELEAQNTGNHQLYNTICNKLYGENKKTGETFRAPSYNGKTLANTPLSEISLEHLKAFENWVLSALNGVNYTNLMRHFVALVKLGCERFGYSYPANYNWRRNMPDQQGQTKKGILSLKDIEVFENFDISTIAPRQKRNAFLFGLYRDFIVFMYYTGIRPVDIIKLHHNREYDAINQQITYLPHKLRSKAKTCKNVMPLTIGLNPKAVAIIEKYKGVSKGGYLFPLPMNETDWGVISLSSPHDIYKRWSIQQNHAIARIDAALKTMAKKMGVGFADLSLYVFRHTTITHLLKYYHVPAAVVAKMCATSLRMIDSTYCDNNFADCYLFQ